MLSLKQLIAGIVLIIVVGAGAFIYRNMMERPLTPDGVTACTLEAKVCPDGTSVGRQGPNCEFAVCAPPNIELSEARIGFVLPAGYTQVASGAPSQETLRIFSKPSASASADSRVRSRDPKRKRRPRRHPGRLFHENDDRPSARRCRSV